MATERYGEARPPHGGRIAAITPRSAAADAGLLVGDLVLAVDGRPVHDILDWQWLASEDAFTVTVDRGGATLTLNLNQRFGEPHGIEFADVVFDGVRECVNACAFCFVSQLPTGLRPALSVRDDDYRLSFLFGNFVTLTNLDDADMDRIIEQRLSPLYISLHAVDPTVRARLVCCTVDDTTLERLDALLAAGIEVHVQIVAVPGVNDGDVLAGTLAWLAPREGVLSVGIVPLGFTSHQPRFTRSFDAAGSSALIDAIAPVQAAMREARDIGWVYAADEFYLNAGRTVPPAEEYDDFPQYENGIGLVRAFLDEFADALPALGEASPDRVTAVSGMLFAPVLAGVLDRAGLAARVRVLPVANRTFGGNVSVTGLLTGRDIIDAVAADGGAGRYLIPDVVVNSDGLLLDDVPADELSARAGADLRVIGSDAASLVTALATVG